MIITVIRIPDFAKNKVKKNTKKEKNCGLTNPVRFDLSLLRIIFTYEIFNFNNVD